MAIRIRAAKSRSKGERPSLSERRPTRRPRRPSSSLAPSHRRHRNIPHGGESPRQTGLVCKPVADARKAGAQPPRTRGEVSYLGGGALTPLHLAFPPATMPQPPKRRTSDRLTPAAGNLLLLSPAGASFTQRARKEQVRTDAPCCVEPERRSPHSDDGPRRIVIDVVDLNSVNPSTRHVSVREVPISAKYIRTHNVKSNGFYLRRSPMRKEEVRSLRRGDTGTVWYRPGLPCS